MKCRSYSSNGPGLSGESLFGCPCNSLVVGHPEVIQKLAWRRSMVISAKPTSGESARFHLSLYRLVARHNFRIVRHSGTIPQRPLV